MLKINQTLFVHAGLSRLFAQKYRELTEINLLYQRALQQNLNYQQLLDHPQYRDLFSRDSPIWYRGYFNGQGDPDQIEQVLQHYQAELMVVGHTSILVIKAYYQGRLYLIDSSIKQGQSGELLCYQDRLWYRATLAGDKFALPQP